MSSRRGFLKSGALALFATGFFRDVSLEVEDSVLVVVLQERPSIAQIEFTGLREFDKEMVLKAMSQIGLAEGRTFDRGLLDRAEQELKRQYLTRARYAASVTTTVTPLERNRVALTFTIDEGAPLRVDRIALDGFDVLAARDLANLRRVLPL